MAVAKSLYLGRPPRAARHGLLCLVELDIPSTLAGTKYIGMLEGRVTGVLREAEAADPGRGEGRW